MPTIYIDNQPFSINDDGKSLLEVCLSLGFNLPFFCWHPAMHSVGACRQCAVKQFKDEKDTHGRIVMSCMTPAKDGTRISIDDPEAVAFRAGIIEWLMVNHPHDCPVCDEGGECHLQDMTEMTGHVYRRMRFPKRTYPSQNLGPFVNHAMNRCIQCYRCVRYYRDVAGGRDLMVMGWHDHVYFGREKDGVLESEFSGNLVEICPTGVFTDKTYDRHYTRKWDLQSAPSICVHCGLGCNTIPGERYQQLRRIRNRYHEQVNGYFLCDRGRYGYAFVNDEQRVRQPLIRSGYLQQPVDRTAALMQLATHLPGKRILGIGSPRASLESNFALRQLVGAENFIQGVSLRHHRLLKEILALMGGNVHIASQREAGRADAIFMLGEDVNNTAPMLAIQLRRAAMQWPDEHIAQKIGVPAFDEYARREAIQNQRSPFFIATTLATRLDDEAAALYRAGTDDLARLGFAVAHALDTEAPAVSGLSDEEASLATRIARALHSAEHPLIVTGCGSGSLTVLMAAVNILYALRKVADKGSICVAVPECNSLGLAMLGGDCLEEVVESLAKSPPDVTIILENDLYHRIDAAVVDELMDHAGRLVVLDHLVNATTARAEIVLPAASFAESTGTLVNHEGRAQRHFAVFDPGGDMAASWHWLGEFMPVLGRASSNPWPHFDDVLSAMANAIPVLAQVPDAAPLSDFRLLSQPVPRQSHRYSGRTAMHADIDTHEQPPPRDDNSPLAFSMEGYQGEPPAALVPRFWAPGWNSIQSLYKYQQSVDGPLHGGPAGVCLFDHSAVATYHYHTDIPLPFSPRNGEWWIVPAYHVFGSEELSVRAPGIAQLAPTPYVAIRPDDARRLGLEEGDQIALLIGGRRTILSLRLAPLPAGVAALSVTLPGMRWVSLPAWGVLVPSRLTGAVNEEKA